MYVCIYVYIYIYIIDWRATGDGRMPLCEAARPIQAEGLRQADQARVWIYIYIYI